MSQLLDPWPKRIFVTSSLAPKHVIKTDNFSSQSGYRLIALIDRTPPLEPDFMHWVLLIIFTRWFTELMMCSIHIDEFVIHVTAVAWPSRLCVPFSKKLDILLACLDNWCMIHSFQCDVCEDRNDVRYCNTMALPSYKYFLRLVLLTISHFFTFSLRVFLSPSFLSHDGRQEGN
jgi:hypothetical protein